jgi:cyclopropane fatty-acyl-phospholipid synthase-like methyltransferase
MDKFQNVDEVFFPDEFKLEFDAHYRHYERYLDAIDLNGKLGQDEAWLDASCGSGYGTNLLSQFCSTVYGYDISIYNTDYAKFKYKNLEFIESLQMSFDCIFSIETIEHMSRSKAKLFIRYLYDHLVDGGSLIVSTPIQQSTNDKPVNPHHVIEYSSGDLKELVSEQGFVFDKLRICNVVMTDNERKSQGLFKFRR